MPWYFTVLGRVQVKVSIVYQANAVIGGNERLIQLSEIVTHGPRDVPD